MNTYSSWLRTNEAFNVCISNVLMLFLFVCRNYPKREYVCNLIVNDSTVQCEVHGSAHTTEWLRPKSKIFKSNKWTNSIFDLYCFQIDCVGCVYHTLCTLHSWYKFIMQFVSHFTPTPLFVLLSVSHICWTMDDFMHLSIFAGRFLNSLCVTELN